ncbi:hypothetical protein GCM10011529_13790 [Polymorphobacter glacialis]|uniref:HTH marR-type domain-containing protein n=1 Tax=Sandarakinorhabdus glacialis TaxID=1614636 RepID=A0A917E655_9SPHN|nr:MarR family transcriptional regulator [Polymorphobacter glacialis]GGE08583.1 hypothetical protein GCM10011529_13790 [Polymorphobacter glacialis]
MDKAEHLQSIMNAGRRIHQVVDTIDMVVSVRFGVSRNDLRCLHLLEEGPATPGEVAVRTGLTSGSVTALIDRLEGAGFVERRRSCADRRSVEIVMNETRLLELRAIHGEIEQWIRDFYSDRPAAEVAATGQALGVFAELLGGFADQFARVKCCPGAGGAQ